MQKYTKSQESQKETSVMKEIGFSLHVSHISEMLLKCLNIFASQPKELCRTPPKPSHNWSCPCGCWKKHNQAFRRTSIRGTFYFVKRFGNLFCNPHRESQIFISHEIFEFASGSTALGEGFGLGSFLL